ncbi:ABC transporter ATP-binding protein/permease [Schlesneria sp.]|uniref:ABC transporter ATP-binding protein/permease n=1 Tax=Schlesneria sp. TaxID=2762018 RepID=UPI002F1DE7EB
MSRLNSRLVPRFVSLSKPYLASEQKWVARGLLALLVVLMLTNTAASVLLNKQTGEFSDALADRDSDRYWRSIYYTLGLIAIAVPVYGLYYYVRDRLTNHWRRWMTTRFINNYFSNTAFYRLTFAAEIDNPDQRIAEDINSFTQKSIYFLLIFIETGLQLIAFCGVLWNISQLLVYFIVVYAIVGTAVTTLVFGRPLVGLNFFQLRREADLRYSLVRVRENAESIAFYRGEKQESDLVLERFNDAYINFNKLVNWQFFLNIFQYAYITMTMIIPGIILAPRVMSGDITIGAVVQATGAFAAIFGALNVIVNKFDVLSYFAAGVSRLDRFAKTLEAMAQTSTVAPDQEHITTQEGDHFQVEQLTAQTPDGKRDLIKDLSLSLNEGDGLLIVGASGGGKSSLLRVLGGLWDYGSGQLTRPGLEKMLFLPQRPYLIIGSLRAQLLYPNYREGVTDEEFQSILEEVNLPNLIERCGGLDVEADWGKMLSLGEQQRLAFARVLLAEKPYVILDEATSALDEKNEATLYDRLRQGEVTLISVTHRPQVARYHTHVLSLTGKGDWELKTAEEYLAEIEPDSQIETA